MKPTDRKAAGWVLALAHWIGREAPLLVYQIVKVVVFTFVGIIFASIAVWFVELVAPAFAKQTVREFLIKLSGALDLTVSTWIGVAVTAWFVIDMIRQSEK